MCLDHPARVSRAAVLDIVPTRHVFATADTVLAMAYEHWFFHAQPPGFPEHLIAGDPEFYLRAKLAAWSAGGHPFDETAVEQYVTHFRDPAAIAASCGNAARRPPSTWSTTTPATPAATGSTARCS
ncbi:hypothetical protein [Paractinoplanes toevensis]|uniref:Uncharacterized protein n=1 Tax=Paractinoplanes toevensis TaxID=571911 RepID=A0A919WCY0_9ACTN|nr:hypothetical protein [Actinoplanes toevensis]GIM97866.1 hypothetical protein Ato02nite_096590 [Actinoplanes toevensis]